MTLTKSRLPWVWPLHTTVQGIPPTELGEHLAVLAQHARAMVGYAHDLDSDGVRWLACLANEHPELKIRMIVLLYAACKTRQGHLEELLDLQTQQAGRVRFYVAACENWSEQPGTGMLFQPAALDQEATLVWALSRNFGYTQLAKSHLNLAFNANEALITEWMNWVNGLTANAAPLDEHTVAIPTLMPAEGTPEAQQLWLAYQASLEAASQGERSDVPMATMDEETGTVKLFSADGQPLETMFDTAEVKIPNRTRLDVQKIYELGSLVTLASSGGIPPLQVPLKPEWLGEKAQRRSGTITKKTQFTVSVFTEDELKDFEKSRKAPRALLDKLAFPFADSTRWMPDTMRAMFEREIKQARDDGASLLKKVVGEKAETFVESKSSKIIEDADGFAKEMTGHGVSDETKATLKTAMTERIDAALSGQDLRNHNFNRIGFNPTGIDDELMWTQAQNLIVRILQYPREVVTDQFKARGFGKLDLGELFAAMDVMGDPAYLKFKRLRKSDAWNELEQITTIVDTKGSSAYERCRALLAFSKSLRDV